MAFFNIINTLTTDLHFPSFSAMTMAWDGTGRTLYIAGTGLSAYSFNGALFVYITTIDTTYSFGAISYRDGFIHTVSYLIATGVHYLRRYSYNGYTFSLLQSVALDSPYGNDIKRAILSDDNYIYVYGGVYTSTSCISAQVRSKSSYTMLKSQYTGPAVTQIFTCACKYKTWQIAGTDMQFVVPMKAILCAFSFSTYIISLAGTRELTLDKYYSDHPVQSICADANYIYVYITGVLLAYTFNGSTFTKKGSLLTYSVGTYNITCDGTYVYLSKNAAMGEIVAYTFNGTNFIAVYYTTDPLSGFLSGGSYLFCARTTPSSLRVYGINKISTFLIKIGANWKNIITAYVRKSGVFKKVRDVKMDLSGTWKNSI